MIIGLTGKRGVGKSEAAKHLENMGFDRVHAWLVGKEMTRLYFLNMGFTESEVNRMMDGDLKEAPNPRLPDGQSPRYFMEKFGKFMGAELGPAWTVGVIMDRIYKYNLNPHVVFESIVYEADYFRQRGGIIVRIERPDFDGPKGIETDKAQQSIHSDFTIINDGDVPDLYEKVNRMIEKLCYQKTATD